MLHAWIGHRFGNANLHAGLSSLSCFACIQVLASSIKILPPAVTLWHPSLSDYSRDFSGPGMLNNLLSLASSRLAGGFTRDAVLPLLLSAVSTGSKANKPHPAGSSHSYMCSQVRHPHWPPKHAAAWPWSRASSAP
jgi:hypothetical protein